MAEIRPFRPLRYAVPDLTPVVAPPYDVISDEQRQELLARDPHNVVHLTLPESPEQAAADLARWQADGVLVRDEEPSYWWLSQDYVGPDGVARTRQGFVAALRATRTQLEPIFLLWDGSIGLDGLAEPDLAVDGDRLWRLDAEFG